MEFKVLGPVRVIGPGGSRIKLASDAQRRLVSHLVLRANTIVRADELGDHLGLSPGALRTSVSRLRRIVGFDTLVTTPPGYELITCEIDALRFEQLLAAARASHDTAETRRILEEALSLWHGEAYAEFRHELWASPECHRLEELRVAAVEDLVQRHLAEHDWTSAITRLEPLLAEHPFRDRPCGLLMEALAGSGRQVDALRAFQDHRRRLLEEVGTEPSPDLVALDRAIASAPPGHHNLPSPWTSFVGRAEEVAMVAGLSDRHRLVTLTGAGGCGKTRLALEAAWTRVRRTSPSGRAETVRWIELAPVVPDGATADAVLERVVRRAARAAGLAATGPDLLDQLARHLERERPVLLILDNAEHLLAPVARLVESILHACPGCRTVVTSREPLGLPGEVVWQVPPLSLPDLDGPAPATVADLQRSDAAHLFIDRVRSARPGLRLDRSSIPAITAICHQLDGLPLAMELAAASVRTTSLHQVAADLQTTLAPLGRGSPADVAHHQTMHASIAWSVTRLDDTERRVLQQLAAFTSPFTEAAAAAVLDGGTASTDLAALHRLVDKGLVQLDDATDRYRLLQTTQHFCRQTERVPTDEPSTQRASVQHRSESRFR